MQTTDCTKFQEDLKAYADSELPLVRRLQVGAHLEHCATCREEVTQMERIARDLSSLENIGEATLSPELRAKVLARLNEVRPLATPSIPFWKRQPLLVFGSVGATLTAATVLILMYKPAEQMAQTGVASVSQSKETAAPAGALPPPATAGMEKQEAPRVEADTADTESFAATSAPLSAPAESRARKDTTVDKARSVSVAPPQKKRFRVDASAKRMNNAPTASVKDSVPGYARIGGDRVLATGGGKVAMRAVPAKPTTPDTKTQRQLANTAKKADESERKNSNAMDTVASEMAVAPPPAAAGPPAPAPVTATRVEPSPARRGVAALKDEEIRIIIEVEDIKAAEQEVERLAKAVGGSVTPDTATAEAERKPLTARIPVKDVESFRKSVNQLGKALPVDTDATKAKSAPIGVGGGGFGGGAAAQKPAPENKPIRVILVRKPAPPAP